MPPCLGCPGRRPVRPPLCTPLFTQLLMTSEFTRYTLVKIKSSRVKRKEMIPTKWKLHNCDVNTSNVSLSRAFSMASSVLLTKDQIIQSRVFFILVALTTSPTSRLKHLGFLLAETWGFWILDRASVCIYPKMAISLPKNGWICSGIFEIIFSIRWLYDKIFQIDCCTICVTRLFPFFIEVTFGDY